MKIALLFSGQPRYVAQCYPNIFKNIIEPNGIAPQDIYCHTWYPDPPHTKEYQICNNTIGTPEDIQDIFKLYHPVALRIDSQPTFKEIVPSEHIHRQYNYPVQGMCESIVRSAELLGLRSRYDIICRIRYDFQIPKEIIFKEYNSKKIHVPAGYNNRITDFFGFGPSFLMLRGYFSWFATIENTFKELNIFTPEELLKHHLESNGFDYESHCWNQWIYRE